MKEIKIREKIKRSKSEKIVFGSVFFFLALYTVSYLYPVFWCLINSLKANREFFRNPFGMPKTGGIQWGNYIKAFSEVNIAKIGLFGMVWNSVWLAFGSSVISVLTSMIVAYIVAKYKFPGKTVMYTYVVVKIILPIVGSFPAEFKLMHDLNLVNSPLILITSIGAFDMYFMLFHAFFASLSWDYAEAAFIDGASHLRVMIQIMLPMASGMLGAQFLLRFIAAWNNYEISLIYMSNFPTLAFGLYKFRTLMTYRSNFPVYFAAVVMAMIPPLVLFAVFQRNIVKNAFAGGLKI